MRRGHVAVSWMVFAITMALAGLELIGEVTGRWESDLQYLMPTLGASFLGLLLAIRQPENRIGILFLVTSLAGVMIDAAESALAWAVDNGSRGLAVAMSHAGEIAFLLLFICLFVLLPLWFPTGRLLTPRWAWVPWVAGLGIGLAALAILFGDTTCVVYQGDSDQCTRLVTNPIGISGVSTSVGDLFMLAAFAMVIPAVVSLVVRYRRSRGVERLQLQWVVLAAVALVIGLATSFIQVQNLLGITQPVTVWLVALAYFGLPLSAYIAIARYRLYEIGRIVSRTVTYVLVLVVLGAAAAAVFFLFARALPFEDDLAVAASTLLAAALFTPVRQRVQRFVDRRFNRARYDAQVVIEEVSSSLRDQVDADVVLSGWVDAVNRTMQPSSVAVWVKEGR